MTDILDAIDAAIGCQQCGAPVGPSVSDDFCDQDCQAAWHAARADQLEPSTAGQWSAPVVRYGAESGPETVLSAASWSAYSRLLSGDHCVVVARQHARAGELFLGRLACHSPAEDNARRGAL